MATASRKRQRHPTRSHDVTTFDVSHLASQPAEHQLLAGLLDLIDRDIATVREIVADVDAGTFHGDSTADILEAIREALATPTPTWADVLAALRRAGRGQGTDAYTLAIELLDNRIGTGPQAARLAREAADELRGLASRRQQADQCHDLLHAIRSTDTTPDEISAGIDRLVAARDAASTKSSKAAGVGIVDCLDRWRLNETPPRVQTGFSPIDRNLGGGLPVGMTVIAAKPKVGKSCLAGQMMLGALLHDPTLNAVWFKGEMSYDQLLCKLLATWSELRHPAIEPVTRREAEARGDKAAAAAVDMAMQTAGRLSIIAPPITPALIASTIRAIRPRLVVIDYIQKVQPDAGHTQRMDKRHEIDDVTTRISAAILELNVAAIVVCSLPKSAQPEDSIGTLAKDSNLLDYEANVFATLWKQQDDGSTLFRINANRDGPDGDEQLWFDGNAQFFRPAAAQVHEEFSNWSGGGR